MRDHFGDLVFRHAVIERALQMPDQLLRPVGRDQCRANNQAAITLGQLLQSHSVDEFDLVCDIEGAELDLVRLDAGVLSRCNLAIIEMHPDTFEGRGVSEAQFVNLLADAGLDIVDREANVIAARNRAFARRNED